METVLLTTFLLALILVSVMNAEAGKLRKEVAQLKAQLAETKAQLVEIIAQLDEIKAYLAKAGQPGGFALLDQTGHLPQDNLTAGYDRHSLYDLGWQSLHTAAAAACRGSTSSGGSGCCENVVLVRNTADKKTCTQICAESSYPNCDGEVPIHGTTGKATRNGQTVDAFYNYFCDEVTNGGSEASSPDIDIIRFAGSNPYFSFCCSRK